MNDGKKRVGRPLQVPLPGQRMSLGLKVTAEIKGRLDQAAKENGRTQSQEAEARLERSFHHDDLLPQLLAAAYGERLAGILMMIGGAMSDAGRQAGFSAIFTLEGSAGWADHPWPYQQAHAAANQILDALRPEGEAVIPKGLAAISNDPNSPLPTGWADHYGAGFANDYLSAAINDEPVADMRRWTDSVQKLLGPDLIKRIERRMRTPRPTGKRGQK